MPPPNATGELHIGHAMFLTIQDLLTRWHRMKGDITLWLPGTDHASIATQNKVEKILMEKEGKTRHDLGRAEFLKQVNQYVKDSQNIIRQQIRKMGCSCDWSRERYTLDPGLTRAVQEMFVRMYNDGLIYRGDRIVNWCPRCESTLADDEVEYREKQGKLYYIVYLLKNQKSKIKNQNVIQNSKFSKDKKFIIVATTRPETMFGDTAVAVNPQDKKYKKLIGQKVILPLVERELKIIADESIDLKFGTGAVKVTPCHDQNDFAIGERYHLEKIKIFNNNGALNNQVPIKYQGLDRFKARQIIVADLQHQGLIDKIENHKHNVGYCYRCDTMIEPMVSRQWFVNVNYELRITNYELRKIVGKSKASLKEMAIAVVKKGGIKIIPKKFEKIYYHWMNNLRDWCISRQIWFGHRIPVWYCHNKFKVQSSKFKVATQNLKLNTAQQFQQLNNEAMKQCGNIIVSTEKPQRCPKCQSTHLTQDTDTLDTWFSSGLWTFSTLGWPKSIKNSKLKIQNYNKMNDLERFHPTSVMETGYDILFFWVARMILMTTYAMGEVPFKTVYLHGLVRDKLGRKMSKSLGNGIDPLDMIKKYGADAVRLSLIIGTTPGNDVRLYEEKIAGYRNFITKIWNIARYILNSKFKIQNSKFQFKIENFNISDKWILYELSELVKRVNKNLEKFQFSRAGEDIYEFMWHKLADWYIEMVKIENQPLQQQILMYVLKKCLILLHPFVPFVTEEIWRLMNYELRITCSLRQAKHGGPANYELLIVKPWIEKIDFEISKTEAQKFAKIQKQIIKKRNERAPKKSITGKEIIQLENYARSLKARLKDKMFLAKAPAAVVQKEKARLREAQAKLKDKT